MRFRTKQRILNRRVSNGQKTLKEMYNSLSHRGNANKNESEIPSDTILHQSEWLRPKTPIIAYGGEDVK